MYHPMVWNVFIYMEVNMKEKVTIVGEPMSVKDFGQLLKDMYEKDENGVPLWKKVFGVTEGSKGHEPEEK
jgi:hypothetical protein